VAFEVLTATYVLTFNDEADNLTIRLQLNSSRTRTAFWIGKTKPTTTNKPLRMFVTGAGAGKCKQQYYSVLVTNCFRWC
jgi:hypothetical protein